MNNYYVPIIKWKRGEQTAIDELSDSVKSKMLPLIEIPPIPYNYEDDEPAKAIDEHIANVCSQISNTLGNRPVFIDLFWLDEESSLEDGRHPITAILEEGSGLGLNLIPVTGYRRNIEYNEAIRNALENELINSICIRLENDDFLNVENRVRTLLNGLGTTEGASHIVVDLKHVSDVNTNVLILPTIINSIPNLNSWLSLTLCGTSFPEDLSDIPADNTSSIERKEWLIWNSLISRQRLLDRSPQFGDYCIANPLIKEVDPRTMQISASIRYTSTNDFIIFKGHSVKRTARRPEGWDQMYSLAMNVIVSSAFCGQAFSWGDNYIYECANRRVSSSNAERWRKVGTNHHLEFIVDQLSNLSYF